MVGVEGYHRKRLSNVKNTRIVGRCCASWSIPRLLALAGAVQYLGSRVLYCLDRRVIRGLNCGVIGTRRTSKYIILGTVLNATRVFHSSDR